MHYIPFNRFLTFFFYLIFGSIPPLHFLKSQSSKLKAFCTCVGAHVVHGTRSAGQKMLLCISTYCTGHSVAHSNDQYLLASGFEPAAYRRESAWLFRPCENTVAHGFVYASFALAIIITKILFRISISFSLLQLSWISLCCHHLITMTVYDLIEYSNQGRSTSFGLGCDYTLYIVKR